MCARKTSHASFGLPTLRRTPPLAQVLPDDAVPDDAVPDAHRAVVYQALARIDYAVRELDSILRTYSPTDARVFDLRHAVTRLDMARHNGHSWLVCHPAQEEQP